MQLELKSILNLTLDPPNTKKSELFYQLMKYGKCLAQRMRSYFIDKYLQYLRIDTEHSYTLSGAYGCCMN